MMLDELFSLPAGTRVVWWSMHTSGFVVAKGPDRVVIRWDDDEEEELTRGDDFLDELAEELTVVVGQP